MNIHIICIQVKIGCSCSIGLGCKVYETPTNIFKHTTINLMVIGELAPKATKIPKKKIENHRALLFRGGYMLFRGVICCSGGLHGCSGGLYDEENNASQLPECRLTGMPHARELFKYFVLKQFCVCVCV